MRVTTKRKRETETKFKSSSRRGSRVREVYAGGVVTIGNTFKRDVRRRLRYIYASGIDRVPAEKYRILREKDASETAAVAALVMSSKKAGSTMMMSEGGKKGGANIRVTTYNVLLVA